MSETATILFDLIIWCQVAALLLNTGIFAWLLLGRKEERKWTQIKK